MILSLREMHPGADGLLRRAALLTITIFVSLEVLSQSTTDRLLLQDGLLVYPVNDFCKKGLFDDRILASPVSTDDVDADFSNLCDLEWLDRFAGNAKGILIGETHHLKFLNQIKTRIIFYLARYHGFTTVLVEDYFSMTPYIQHFIGIADDTKAQHFFYENLDDFISTREDSIFYQHIRRWNKYHPQNRINLGFYDVGSDYDATWEKVIAPFMEKAGIPMPAYTITATELLSIIPELVAILSSRIPVSVTLSCGVSLDSQFILDTLKDMESAIRSVLFDKLVYRQLGIVDNLTGVERLGNLTVDSKFVLYGGSYHMNKSPMYPADYSFLREAGFLNNKWPNTLGKIRSVLLSPGALTVDRDLLEFDPAAVCAPISPIYTDWFVRTKAAWRSGIIHRDDLCFVNGYPTIYEKEMTLYGIRHRLDAYYVENPDWRGLETIALTDIESLEIEKAKLEFEGFDAVIFITTSPATYPRNYTHRNQPRR